MARQLLLVAVTIILAAGASQALVTRFGTKTILTVGMALLVLGLLVRPRRKK